MKAAPVLIISLFLFGCNQNEIDVYRLAKYPSQAGVPVGLPEGHPPVPPPSTTSANTKEKVEIIDVHWDLPEGWTQVPSSGMRVATIFMGSNLEMSVIRLFGDAGGLLANINRWRGQLDLGPISEEELKKDVRILKGKLGDIQYIEYENQNEIRLITGILPYKGFTWFFKAMGPTEALGQQRKKIQSLLTQVHAAD